MSRWVLTGSVIRGEGSVGAGRAAFETILYPAATLTWISQTYWCIGAENLRKLLCCNNFSQVQEHPDADRVYVGAV